jgi:hypothetical protein
MNCNEAIERLPWLLNGTLGEEERRQVMAHLEDCAACRAALRETREAWRIYDQHIPAEDLVAHAWGEAPVTVAPGLLEEHLASCPRCAAELELARMSRRLEEDDRIAVMPARRPAPAPAGERRSGFWRAAALAASLAAVAGLGGWVYSVGRVQSLETRLAEARARPAPPAAMPPASPAPEGTADRERLAQLQGELERLRQVSAEQGQQARQLQEQIAALREAERPSAGAQQVNAFVASVTALGATVRGEAPSGRVEEIPADRPAALMLSTQKASAGYPAYEIEVLDSNGKVRWSRKGLERSDENGEYTPILPQGALAPGAYTIQIHGVRGGAREPLERYAIRVR